MMMCSWDAFVDSLAPTKYGAKEATKEGRPSYDPKGMYKLYIYSSLKEIFHEFTARFRELWNAVEPYLL